MPYPSDNRYVGPVVLLRNATGVQNSRWFELKGMHPVVVTVEGSFGGNAFVKILVSNDPNEPAVGDINKPQLGGTISIPLSYIVDASYKWIRVRIDTYNSGTISAFLFGGRGPSWRD